MNNIVRCICNDFNRLFSQYGITLHAHANLAETNRFQTSGEHDREILKVKFHDFVRAVPCGNVEEQSERHPPCVESGAFCRHL